MSTVFNIFRSLPWPARLNYIFYFVMSIFYISYGVITIISDKATTEQLLSYILGAIGIFCLQDFLSRFYFMESIKSDIEEIKIRDDQGRSNTVWLSTRKQIEQELPLTDRYLDAKEINMFSYANYSIFQPNYITYIEDGINAGTIFKFVGVNPDSDKIENIIEYKMLNHSHPNPMETTWNTYNRIKNIRGYSDNQILYKVCDLDFPYGLTIVHKRDGETTVKVDLYSIMVSNQNRRSMFLSTKNAKEIELINFFLAQWNTVWDISEQYVPRKELANEIP